MIDATLQAALAEPIGNREKTDWDPENLAAARRAQKIWLPEGKRSASSRAERDRRQEAMARQIDIEEAIVASGGHRGTAGAR